MNLIEKLQARRDQFNSFSRHEVFDKNDLADAVQTCIDIVKQHSEWISVDERLPPNVTDEEKNYLLLIHKEWGCFIIGQYIKENDEINSYMGNDPISDFAYWMPIPQPPSEVQL